MNTRQIFTFTKPKPFSELHDVNEVAPYTLGKEKVVFDHLNILTIGIVLLFILGGFWAYKILDIVAQQDLKIEQLEQTVREFKTVH